MTQDLHEFVDNRSQSLRVDRDRAVVRGVKLLGLTSENGRRYSEVALASAVPLYEGAKVNINHASGGPSAPRNYEERIGTVQQVEFRAGEGLFANLHYNPKHAIAEQLIWDAENASENVGLSHSVTARTRPDGDTLVVEAITKVASVDLVADPATTRGLFENRESGIDIEAVSLEVLKERRPDLVSAIVRETSLATSPAVSREQFPQFPMPGGGNRLSGHDFARAVKR